MSFINPLAPFFSAMYNIYQLLPLPFTNFLSLVFSLYIAVLIMNAFRAL